MIRHYLKIACRNLLKYKTQSIISILGLAIGFTCFALAVLWIRYEMTYDTFHEGFDRIHLVYQKSALSDTGVTTTIPYPVSTSLEKQFPEVEDACGFLFYEQEVTVDDGAIRQLYEINADSCFMHMFGIQVLSGSLDFLESEERIALTEHAAKELFGTENPIGKEIKLYGAPKTVCAIVNGWNRHTNLPFSILTGGIRQWHNAWYHGGFHVFIKLHKEVNAEAFQKKLEQTKLETDSKGGMQNLMVMPISKCHYTVLADQNAIQFSYILFFSIVGGLVILCSLINYLSLFVSRLRMRSRELALRKVCGSSDLHLFILLVTEYLLILLAAGLMGMALIELVLSPFKELSGVKEGDIYWESFLYFALVIGCSLATFLPVTFYFNKRTLQSNIQQKTVNRYGYLGRKISIVFQLSISICFIFCISVIMKQLYYLSTTDIGIERKNIATLSIYPQNNLLPAADKIEQFPYVTQVLKGHFSLLPKTASMAMHFKDWDGKQPGDAEIDMEVLMESEELAQFYGIRLLKGKMLKEGERDAGTIVINEAAAKALGWNDPIGKKLIRPNGTGTTVIGLVKDFHTTSPTTPIKPIAFIAKGFSGFDLGKGDVLIKYREGEWPKLKKDIEQLCQKEYPENKIRLSNMEETYDNYLKSEQTLLKLLSCVAVVCILIAVFGVFSLVTLACEQRRKEIAIRKVNGATLGNILSIFIKEYLILLLCASFLAFPVSYMIMKAWLENYVEQISIGVSMYVTIFTGIGIIITACIGWRVWKAARENPAEVVKTE